MEPRARGLRSVTERHGDGGLKEPEELQDAAPGKVLDGLQRLEDSRGAAAVQVGGG
jgi:hypothetical protein